MSEHPDSSTPRGRAGLQRLMSLRTAYAVLFIAVAGLIAAAFWPQESAWPAHAARSGRIVLTVQTPHQQARFDMPTLQALPQVTHTVATPWYPRKVSFEGPLLRDVLAVAEASGTRIDAIAVNDFTAEIPFSDARDYDVIIALRMNGKPMSSRDKGPLFLIYPYDQLPAARRQRYYDVSVWQLDGLEVR